jgi:NADPH:quinone reductase-like Zn-dependent oxidoreductase
MTGETMRAIRMHQFGGPNVLIEETVPRPVAGPGQVRVRIRAVGVNPYEWKLRKGMFPSGVTFPLTPGSEIAGTVDTVGDGVSGFHVDDDVFAATGTMGAYAEYLVVNPAVLALKPRSLDYLQAASAPVGTMTAWQALFDHGKLQIGQTALVHGASGTVGLFAVQLAKWKGAKVIGTASAKHTDLVRSRGADAVVAYDQQQFEDVAHDIDLVVDPIGGETQRRSFAVLKSGGALVALTEPPSQDLARRYGVHAEIMSMRPSATLLTTIAGLFDQGLLRTSVAEVLPLADAARAQDDLEHNRPGLGKIVLRVD